jgi:citrate synthase
MADEQLLSTAEVALRLRIKPETVYAYVSRGLLTSVRLPGERGSRFRLADVERLAARTQATKPEREAPGMQTAITLIAYGRLHYRGLDAVELSKGTSFEEVARWLWTGSRSQEPFTAPPETVERAELASAHLPVRSRLFDRLPVIVAMAAAMDPLRFDLSPDTVADCAPALLATMVDALPPLAEAVDATLAGRLWSRMTAKPATPQGIHALNAALVLLADHDLAASTIAVRVAASTRAHPYAAVSAGLGALDGPLHGAVGAIVHRMIETAQRDGAAVAISEQLRIGSRLPGFGMALYPDGDPRGAALMRIVREMDIPDGLRTALDELPAVAGGRGEAHPNVDFGLSALAHATGMGVDAPEVVFTVARTAGWLAHIIEEYAQPPHRFRWRSGYTGPPPGH